MYTRKIHEDKIGLSALIFISSTVILSLQGQQSLPIPRASKIKMASLVKRPCLNGQNNLWGCFRERKKSVLSIMASGVQCTTLCVVGSLLQMNTNTCLMERCLSHDLVSCFCGLHQCRQFMLYLQTDEVYKISIFKEYLFVCPLWKFQILNSSTPSEFQ